MDCLAEDRDSLHEYCQYFLEKKASIKLLSLYQGQTVQIVPVMERSAEYRCKHIVTIATLHAYDPVKLDTLIARHNLFEDLKSYVTERQDRYQMLLELWEWALTNKQFSTWQAAEELGRDKHLVYLMLYENPSSFKRLHKRRKEMVWKALPVRPETRESTHNAIWMERENLVYGKLLEKGPSSSKDLQDLEMSRSSVKATVIRLREKGLVTTVGRKWVPLPVSGTPNHRNT